MFPYPSVKGPAEPGKDHVPIVAPAGDIPGLQGKLLIAESEKRKRKRERDVAELFPRGNAKADPGTNAKVVIGAEVPVLEEGIAPIRLYIVPRVQERYEKQHVAVAVLVKNG